jgi:hypothetical protein
MKDIVKNFASLVYVFRSTSPDSISCFSFQGSYKVPKVCKVKGILYTLVRFLNLKLFFTLGKEPHFWFFLRFLGPASSYIALGKTLKSRKRLNGVPYPIALAIPWGLWFMAKSKKLQEMSLDMQLNSQDILGCTMLAKRVFVHIRRTLKKSAKPMTKRLSTNL